MKRILFFLLFLCSQTYLYSQSIEYFNAGKTYSHNEYISTNTIKTFKSVNEAEGVIRSILNVVGLKPNFETRAADISNAAAVIYNGKRYILYDRAFIEAINNATSTNWAGISILAHEIGHHLNGHTLNRGGSNPSDELEADEFSGFVLRKMGASLQEAQAAMHTISENYETSTHPARKRRLRAIALGWDNAGEQNIAMKQPAGEVNKPVRDANIDATPINRSGSNQGLASRYILKEVYLNIAPKNKFYITTNYNLVGVRKNQLVLYGKMKKTNSKKIPFVLTDDKSSIIYITYNGYLINSEGKKVGFIKEYKG